MWSNKFGCSSCKFIVQNTSLNFLGLNFNVSFIDDNKCFLALGFALEGFQ